MFNPTFAPPFLSLHDTFLMEKMINREKENIWQGELETIERKNKKFDLRSHFDELHHFGEDF